MRSKGGHRQSQERGPDHPAALVRADPDAALLAALRRGEPGAFDELYERYLAPVYGYALVALGGHHEAEDAAHDVFLKLLRAVEGFEDRGVPLRVWLFRIVRNHVLDRHARAARSTAYEPGALVEMLDARERCGSRRPDDDLGLAPGEEFVRLTRGLSLGQRRVLFLRFALGLEVSDAAAALGISPAAARDLQHRGLKALRLRHARARNVAAISRPPDPPGIAARTCPPATSAPETSSPT